MGIEGGYQIPYLGITEPRGRGMWVLPLQEGPVDERQKGDEWERKSGWLPTMEAGPRVGGSSPLPAVQTLPYPSTLYSSQGQVPAEEEAGGAQGRVSGSRETPEEPPGWQAHLTSCGGSVRNKVAFIGPGEGAGGGR